MGACPPPLIECKVNVKYFIGLQISGPRHSRRGYEDSDSMERSIVTENYVISRISAAKGRRVRKLG